MRNDPDNPRPTSARPPGVPSRRAVGALVAGALAIGLIAGASLAPAPPSSLASGSSLVTRLLALLAAGGGRPATGAASTSAPSTAAPAGGGGGAKARAASEEAATLSSAAGASTPNEGVAPESTPSEGGEKSPSEHKPVRLPPISHVWLIVLDGPGLTGAASDPTGYPYLTGQLLKAGTQLERYSAIEAYELAGDAALLTGGVDESVSTISEPCAASSAPSSGASSSGVSTTSTAAASGSPCPGAAAGSAAAGGQSEADAFLQRAVAPILASAAYGERGLVVVTFGSAAQEPDLSETTLASSPAPGALLLSPTLKAGGHSSEAFDSLAPRQSLEAIFAAS